MADLAKTQDLEGLARIIDPPAWLEHDDLIKRAEGWERANRDRPDEDFVRRAKGRRADAAELVRMSLAKAEKAWGWVDAALKLQSAAAAVLSKSDCACDQAIKRLHLGLPYAGDDNG
jgi:hypothetical protein